jgi:septum formation protein
LLLTIRKSQRGKNDRTNPILSLSFERLRLIFMLKTKLVLASASPRRAEILAAAGVPFVKKQTQFVDETPFLGESPRDYVMRLARDKARTVTTDSGEIVLGADTTVVLDSDILGKPADSEEAASMLLRLSGRDHEVLTGICLRTPTQEIVDCASTRVWFARLSDAEIAAYAASGEPMDKAGAYGIQGLASKFVTRIEGCYFNVMGLPIALVYAHLRRVL